MVWIHSFPSSTLKLFSSPSLLIFQSDSSTNILVGFFLCFWLCIFYSVSRYGYTIMVLYKAAWWLYLRIKESLQTLFLWVHSTQSFRTEAKFIGHEFKIKDDIIAPFFILKQRQFVLCWLFSLTNVAQSSAQTIVWPVLWNPSLYYTKGTAVTL